MDHVSALNMVRGAFVLEMHDSSRRIMRLSCYIRRIIRLDELVQTFVVRLVYIYASLV